MKKAFAVNLKSVEYLGDAIGIENIKEAFLTIVILIMVIVPVIFFIKHYEPRIYNTEVKVGNTLPVSAEEIQKISKSKFYILIIDKKNVFPEKYRWPTIEVTNEKLGGLMEIADLNSNIVKEIFGQKNNKNKIISSVVIITDKNAKIIGIYNNKKLSDIISLMQLHPGLIDLHLAGTAL